MQLTVKGRSSSRCLKSVSGRYSHASHSSLLDFTLRRHQKVRQIFRFNLGNQIGFLFTTFMATVSIGPHLFKNGMRGLAAPELEHTGYTLELSSDEFVLNASIYRQIRSWQPTKIPFDGFFVQFDQVPFRLTPASEIREKDSTIGALVSLDAVLCSLYIKHEVKRPIISLLQELRNDLPLNHCSYPRIENGTQMIQEDLGNLGFEVVGFFSFGRTITVQFGWVFPQDRRDSNCKLCLYAGSIEFKPRPDRTLGKGAWRPPLEVSVSYLLADWLELMGKPGMLSEMGVQAAVDNFKWTRVSLLTNTEAAKARIDFVRDHPELHNNHQSLAKALKEAELYSDTMEIYAIKKQVLKLIEKAKSQ